jgi:hypothetical protein
MRNHGTGEWNDGCVCRVSLDVCAFYVGPSLYIPPKYPFTYVHSRVIWSRVGGAPFVEARLATSHQTRTLLNRCNGPTSQVFDLTFLRSSVSL